LAALVRIRFNRRTGTARLLAATPKTLLFGGGRQLISRVLGATRPRSNALLGGAGEIRFNGGDGGHKL